MVSNINIDKQNMQVDYVTKRDGGKEEMQFDKILRRIKNLSDKLNINPTKVTQKVCSQIYPDIHTSELDELASQICTSLSTEHLDYAKLASNIIISNHHKNTSPSITEKAQILFNNTLISEETYNIIIRNGSKLNDVINYDRDFDLDYFGFKTLEKSYLMRVNNVIIERPQDLFMRVSIGIHGEDIKDAIETYDLMSQKYFIHATPTLFNAGTNRPQLSSCFLLAMKDDSIDGIFSTLKDCALISKWAGGIGLHLHNVRAKNSKINGTNGISNGLTPMLRVFNNTARYVDQCVTPNTIIYTKNGPIQIQNCNVGETEIYNSTGNTEIIENILEHPYKDTILTIKTLHSIDDLMVTPEHPIYVLRNQSIALNYDVILNRIKHNRVEFEWCEAKKLNKTDMIVYTIPKYSKDITYLNSDDCYFYGILLGYGSLNNTCRNGYIIVNTINNTHIIDNVKTYLNNKFIEFKEDIYENTTRIRWNKTVNLPFKYSDLYDTNKEKYCNFRLLNLPLNKCKYILKGLIDTNECNSKEIVIDNTSRNLIECLRFVCLKMGILTSGYSTNNSGKNNYTLKIPKTESMCKLLNITYNSAFFKFLKYDDKLLTRIQSIEESNYDGTLYDLQMTKVHDYMLHNGLVHNGGGKRNGSIAIYIEPWHKDIRDFLLLRKNHGNEEDRARDLFYALWMPDLFMKRVKENKKWTLMCPNVCKGLSDCYGDEFEALYEKYEIEHVDDNITIDARELWFAICESQIETGTPYICYKDAANRKSNQKNLGTIKSSNLCTEIMEYSAPDQYAVCNLASIGLSRFVNLNTNEFDYDLLYKITKIITKNLNKVIDKNYYPVPEAEYSNKLHRPIGIGVQGLADVFALLKISFDSKEAQHINSLIFETIYYASLETSMEICRKRAPLIEKIKFIQSILDDKNHTNDELNTILDKNKISSYKSELKTLMESMKPIKEELNMTSHLGSYSSFENSPISNGLFQFDLWNEKPTSNRYNWDSLRKDIMKHGIRNSLLLAPMPTASTSQILGNNECIEPFNSAVYLRRVLAGEYIVINKYLIKDLIDLNMYDETMKNKIIANNGSIQNISEIPEHIKNIYKTVWELGNKILIDMAAERGKYICQSQSLNLFLDKPDFDKLSSMHFYSWNKGLKTGIYYLRTKPVAQAQQFTIEPEKQSQSPINNEPILACRRDDPDCLSCGS
jgi:ribonucleotide reductase alpha subunit